MCRKRVDERPDWSGEETAAPGPENGYKLRHLMAAVPLLKT